MSIFALGGVIATQLNDLAGDLPRYQSAMREKIKSLRGTTATSGTLERAADVLQDLGKELSKPKDRHVPPAPSTPPPGRRRSRYRSRSVSLRPRPWKALPR